MPWPSPSSHCIPFDEPIGVGDELVVPAVAVGLGETEDGQAGFVVAVERAGLVDAAVGLDEAFEVLEALGHQRVFRRAARAKNRGGHDGGHARPGVFGIRPLGLLGGSQELDRPIDRPAVRLGVDRLGRRRDRRDDGRRRGRAKRAIPNKTNERDVDMILPLR